MIALLEGLPGIREKHRLETIALAGGVFDLLHPGHIDLFKRMKKAANIGVVAVSSDSRVKERKGPLRPIQPENERLEVVDSIKYVDFALIAPEPTADSVPTVQVMKALRPDVFLSSEDSWLEYPELFEELGVEFQLVPRFSDEISTTSTIARVLQTHKVENQS